MHRILSAGDVVMIYEDPLIKEREEGLATLKIRLWAQPGDLERWMVQFLDDVDGNEYQRFIDPNR